MMSGTGFNRLQVRRRGGAPAVPALPSVLLFRDQRFYPGFHGGLGCWTDFSLLLVNVKFPDQSLAFEEDKRCNQLPKSIRTHLQAFAIGIAVLR